MKKSLFSFCALLIFSMMNVHVSAWKPSSGHAQMPLWPKRVSDTQPVKPEETKTVNDPMVAGKPRIQVSHVSQPTMTVYAPRGKNVKNTGVAVVVFPGGAYQMLNIDLEGTEVCDWLTSRGITCVLLKYRVPASPRSAPDWGAYPQSQMALEDAQRTMSLVRFRAVDWHIDPRKIGVLGFSAGGHLAAAVSTHFKERLYKAVDAADKESCRPDFAIALYPGHLWIDEEKFELNSNIPVTREVPPTFLLQAGNDPVDNVRNSLVYYLSLKDAGVPVEMHLYAEGGHGFGLRHAKLPITAWPQLVETWLTTISMVSK